MQKFSIIFLLLTLTSCYSTASKSPQGITVYRTEFTNFLNEQPIDIADKHCSQYGKIAVFKRKGWLLSEEEFKCEKNK